MQNIRVISEAEKEMLNKRLKSYGITVSGGSYESANNRWCIGLNKTSIDVNYPEIARELLLDLEGKDIIVDHQLYQKPQRKQATA